jgi:hypothetical protein
MKNKIKSGKPRQMKWVNDVNRMKFACLRVKGNKVLIYGPGEFCFSITCLKNETPESLRQILAEKLAGQNIGDTVKILNTLGKEKIK